MNVCILSVQLALSPHIQSKVLNQGMAMYTFTQGVPTPIEATEAIPYRYPLRLKPHPDSLPWLILGCIKLTTRINQHTEPGAVSTDLTLPRVLSAGLQEFCCRFKAL